MSSEHIVKSYDEELNHLNENILKMGGLAEALLASAIESISQRDPELAAVTVREDRKIDEIEAEIDQQVIRLLALRQPMARDLRNIVGALKMAPDIERVGDYAANVAKRAIPLCDFPPAKSISTVPRMGKIVQHMIKDVLDAFTEGNAEKAKEVWARDEEVDDLYDGMFRELLTYMMEDPRNITPCAHLLFVAKNIERIGDHVTNIAERVLFLVEGAVPDEARPKEDRSAFTVVESAKPKSKSKAKKA